MLDTTVVLFIEHNLCFRESVGSHALLIFPELINRKRPPSEGPDMVDDISYTIQGAVANVYAALVVLLGYTNTFTRTQQWQVQAQYKVGDDEICGFRQIGEREGEIELVLSYGIKASTPTRLIFQGLFERILLGAIESNQATPWPFFGSLLEFITSGPVVAAIVEGPRAIAAFRQVAGGTDPVEKATPGTIRGDFGLETQFNLVHGSDSTDSAKREIALWFPDI